MNKKVLVSHSITSEPLDLSLSLSLLKKCSKLSKVNLEKHMHLSAKLLDETYAYYHHFNPSQLRYPALHLYSGLSYRQLPLFTYTLDEVNYLQNHLRILSALYGVLKPYDLIYPYRLDFTMSLPGIHPKKLWEKKILEAFKNEDWIINLASEEFSSLFKSINNKLFHVHFYDLKNNQLFLNSAEAKKARGQYLHLCVQHCVQSPHHLHHLTLDGYELEPTLSTAQSITYIRSKTKAT